MNTSSARLPTYFVGHGGGPWPWIKDLLPVDMTPLETSLQDIPRHIGYPPRAVLVISGHWEEPEFTVQTGSHPPLLYDYYGFPAFTYDLDYPAVGSPEIADRVTTLLGDAAIAVRHDTERGFDHGVFAPLYVMYPNADVPILQLSLKQGYDPGTHLAAGRALAPLRDEGVLIVGSGLSYHNLRIMGPAAKEPSRQFDDWLTTTLVDADPAERTAALEQWEHAPSARIAHAQEDHLIPLLVALGAAEHDHATRTYHEETFGGYVTTSSFRFG
jgi:aromatic ring-opening dioxygenase catalytic subunit (LigB family)